MSVAVIGRRWGDDEDCCCIYDEVNTREEAIAAFEQEMRDIHDNEELSVENSEDAENILYVTRVLHSASPITIM